MVTLKNLSLLTLAMVILTGCPSTTITLKNAGRDVNAHEFALPSNPEQKSRVDLQGKPIGSPGSDKYSGGGVATKGGGTPAGKSETPTDSGKSEKTTDTHDTDTVKV